jgi:hypothetical protein
MSARKLLLPAILLFACTSVTLSQTPPTTNRNLYSTALLSSILQMEKEYAHIDDSVLEDRERTDYRHMLVRKAPVITDGLPLSFEGHAVEYLDSEGLIRRYKKLKKPFAVLEILPLHNDGDRLGVRVVVSWVSVERKRLNLAISDWSDVHFRYDCGKKQFIVDSIKLDGI